MAPPAAKHNCKHDGCSKAFKTPSDLRRHELTHDPNRTSGHVCGVCQKKFNQPGQLKIHMNHHTGERPYQCHFCTMRFGDPSLRTRHMRKCPHRPSHGQASHTGARPKPTTPAVEAPQQMPPPDPAPADFPPAAAAGDLPEPLSIAEMEALFGIQLDPAVYNPAPFEHSGALPDTVNMADIENGTWELNDSGPYDFAAQNTTEGAGMPELDAMMNVPYLPPVMEDLGVIQWEAEMEMRGLVAP